MKSQSRIKTLLMTTFEAELKFGNVVKGSKIYLIWEYEFDKNGNKIKEFRYETDGKLNEKRTYTFNELNQKIEKKVFDNDEALYLHKKYRYKEDECFKYTKLNDKEFRLENIFKHDNLGNRIEKTEYNSLGKIIGVYKYKYDRKNNCVEEIRYKYDGNLDFIIKNKYDKKGNQIRTKRYNSDGSLDSKSKYKYDDDSNCIKMSFYKSDNSLENSYSYDFDFHGNVIKSRTISSQGTITKERNLTINMTNMGIGLN